MFYFLCKYLDLIKEFPCILWYLYICDFCFCQFSNITSMYYVLLLLTGIDISFPFLG